MELKKMALILASLMVALAAAAVAADSADGAEDTVYLAEGGTAAVQIDIDEPGASFTNVVDWAVTAPEGTVTAAVSGTAGSYTVTFTGVSAGTATVVLDYTIASSMDGVPGEVEQTMSFTYEVEVVASPLVPGQQLTLRQGEASDVPVSTGAEGFLYYAGLPAGLSMDPSGYIHGTPAEAGEHEVTVTATHVDGHLVFAETYELTVLPALNDAFTFAVGGAVQVSEGTYTYVDDGSGLVLTTYDADGVQAGIDHVRAVGPDGTVAAVDGDDGVYRIPVTGTGAFVIVMTNGGASQSVRVDVAMASGPADAGIGTAMDPSAADISSASAWYCYTGTLSLYYNGGSADAQISWSAVGYSGGSATPLGITADGITVTVGFDARACDRVVVTQTVTAGGSTDTESAEFIPVTDLDGGSIVVEFLRYEGGDVVGTTVITESTLVPYGGDFADVPVAEARVGYAFVGWFAQGSEEEFDPSGVIDSDMQVAAVWTGTTVESDSFRVIFDVTDGIGHGDVSFGDDSVTFSVHVIRGYGIRGDITVTPSIGGCTVTSDGDVFTVSGITGDVTLTVDGSVYRIPSSSGGSSGGSGGGSGGGTVVVNNTYVVAFDTVEGLHYSIQSVQSNGVTFTVTVDDGYVLDGGLSVGSTSGTVSGNGMQYTVGSIDSDAVVTIGADLIEVREPVADEAAGESGPSNLSLALMLIGIGLIIASAGVFYLSRR